MATFAGNPAATSLTGTEIVPITQGGVDKRTTTQEIANLAGISGDLLGGPGIDVEVDSNGDTVISLSSASRKFVNIALSDMSTALTTGTGVAAWFAPEDGELVAVFTGIDGQSSSGSVTVDMNDSGGTIFTTEPSIQATEDTSLTGTNAVLDGTITFLKGAKFTFDITAAGTGASGLQVSIEYAPA